MGHRSHHRQALFIMQSFQFSCNKETYLFALLDSSLFYIRLRIFPIIDRNFDQSEILGHCLIDLDFHLFKEVGTFCQSSFLKLKTAEKKENSPPNF